MRLLIVEDEKQMCDTVARSLYAAGYEVDTCYDGAEALECILAENYDLIVLDLNLPGMDGMDLLKELRKENEETKVLLLHLGRPVSQEELIEHVWDASVDSFSGSIRVHMSSLRRKLRAVLGYDPILNKVGEGYQIREESDR